MSAQSRRWCYTQFSHETDSDGETYTDYQHDDIRFHVYQLEVCPDTEREHRQGYLEFSSPKRLSWLKNNIDSIAHWESAKGSRQSCYDYCTKELSRLPDTEPFIYGEWEQGGQGSRNDIKAMHEMVKSGKHTMDEIADECTSAYYRYKKVITEELRWPEKTWETQILIYYGPSGSGKSTLARRNFPDAYYKVPDNGWWDGYQGQETTIIDEFKGGINPRELQRICDPGRPRIQIKGSSTQFMSHRLVIISNFHPDYWWDEELLTPIMRRTTELREFESLPQFTVIDWPEVTGHYHDAEPTQEQKT